MSVENTTSVETSTSTTEAPMNDIATGTDTILQSEGQLLNDAGHTLPGTVTEGSTITGNTTTTPAEEPKPKTDVEIYADLVNPHLTENLSLPVLLGVYSALYPESPLYAQRMANEEWSKRQEERYSHLVIKAGSFQQTGNHPTFKNKIFAELLCPSSNVTGGHVSMIWVPRATSDFFTFKGCPAFKKIVSKGERALKGAAAAGTPGVGTGAAIDPAAVAKVLAQLLGGAKA